MKKTYFLIIFALLISTVFAEEAPKFIYNDELFEIGDTNVSIFEKIGAPKTEIEKYLGKGILVSVEDNDTLIYEYSFSNKNYPSFPIDYQFFYKDTILSSIVVNFINF